MASAERPNLKPASAGLDDRPEGAGANDPPRMRGLVPTTREAYGRRSGPEGLGRLEQARGAGVSWKVGFTRRMARPKPAADTSAAPQFLPPVIVTRMGGKPAKAGSVELGAVRASGIELDQAARMTVRFVSRRRGEYFRVCRVKSEGGLEPFAHVSLHVGLCSVG